MGGMGQGSEPRKPNRKFSQEFSFLQALLFKAGTEGSSLTAVYSFQHTKSAFKGSPKEKKREE